MNTTTNLSLNKPELTDPLSPTPLNENMDILDAAVGQLVQQAGSPWELITSGTYTITNKTLSAKTALTNAGSLSCTVPESAYEYDEILLVYDFSGSVTNTDSTYLPGVGTGNWSNSSFYEDYYFIRNGDSSFSLQKCYKFFRKRSVSCSSVDKFSKTYYTIELSPTSAQNQVKSFTVYSIGNSQITLLDIAGRSGLFNITMPYKLYGRKFALPE